jgi:hypothetical protein
MWFNNLNKEQFTLYAKQEARLNTAYWLTALILHKCETCNTSALVRSEIASIKGQVAFMLQCVCHDIEHLRGLPHQLIQQQLKHIVTFCRHSLRDTNKRFSYKRQGMEIPGDMEQTKNEMAFIKARANIIDDADLLEQWDRGIYIICDAFNLHTLRHSIPEYKHELKLRFRAAIDLMTPGHDKIQQHCQAYIYGLGLEDITSDALISEQIACYCDMFDAGLALANHSTRVMFTFHSIMPNASNELTAEKWQQESETIGNVIQERLIYANLARTNSILDVVAHRAY